MSLRRRRPYGGNGKKDDLLWRKKEVRRKTGGMAKRKTKARTGRSQDKNVFEKRSDEFRSGDGLTDRPIDFRESTEVKRKQSECFLAK